MAFTEKSVLVPGENHDNKAVYNNTYSFKWLLHFKSPCNSNKVGNYWAIIELKTKDIPGLPEETARRMKQLVWRHSTAQNLVD